MRMQPFYCAGHNMRLHCSLSMQFQYPELFLQFLDNLFLRNPRIECTYYMYKLETNTVICKVWSVKTNSMLTTLNLPMYSDEPLFEKAPPHKC